MLEKLVKSVRKAKNAVCVATAIGLGVVGGGGCIPDMPDQPDFNPKDYSIAFTLSDILKDEKSDLFVINYDGSGFKQLTNDEYKNCFPRWNNQGTEIAFSYINRWSSSDEELENFVGGIKIVNPESREIKTLTKTEPGNIDYFAVWRKDDRQLLFTRTNWGEGEEKGYTPCYIYIVNQNGANLRRLTDTEKDAAPIWSPDGKKIGFVTWRHGNDIDWLLEIYVANRLGGKQKRLTFNEHDEFPIGWSPDSKKIYAIRQIEQERYKNTRHIYEIDVETGDERELTEEEFLKTPISLITCSKQWFLEQFIKTEEDDYISTNIFDPFFDTGRATTSHDNRFTARVNEEGGFEVVENKEGGAVYYLTGKIREVFALREQIGDLEEELKHEIQTGYLPPTEIKEVTE